MINHPSYPEKDEEKEAAVERARASIGKGDYDVLGNNCENFVTEVLTGKGRSRQAERVGPIIQMAAATFLALTDPDECKYKKKIWSK